jgi:multidrug efflux system outer membrane protein
MSRAIAAVLAAALTGCTLAPAYQRPAAPVPASWPTGPAYPAASGAAQVAGWRDVMADPKLRAVIEQALANNRDLRIAVANIAQSRAQFHIQRADLFPAITANGGATYASEPLAALAPQAGAGTVREHLYSASVGFSAYELDVFGRVRSLTIAAQEQYFASEEARRAVQISLVAEVATDWLTLASDEDLLAIAKDTVLSTKQSLDLTRNRFNGGIASQVDVSQAQVEYDTARGDVASFTTQVAQDRNALDLVVGAPVPDHLLPTTLGMAPPLTETPAGISSAILLNRPDVIEAEHQLKAQNADIGAARAAFLPQITLTGSYGSISPSLSRLFAGPAAAWTFAPNIVLPLFEGGRNIAGLRSAEAQRDAAVASYEKAIQTAFRETADSLARRGTIADQLSAERAGTDAADDALRLINARYQRGSDTFLNVLIAQRTLYLSRQSLVRAELADDTSLVTLYKALGGGWQ